MPKIPAISINIAPKNPNNPEVINITKADNISTIDIIFGFFEINTTAIIAIIENNIENNPPVMAESTLKPAPKNNAAVAPINPKTPPIIPKTNSAVLDPD